MQKYFTTIQIAAFTSEFLASELKRKHKPTQHKTPQIRILLCITDFSSKFKAENKGDHGNSSRLQ
jgi:hypothetical protein